MKLKQFIALFCVATLCLSIFCSCGKKDKKKSYTTTTTIKQETKKTITTEKNVAVVATTDSSKNLANHNISQTDSKKTNSQKAPSNNISSKNTKLSSTNNSSASSSTKVPTKHKHKYVNGVCSCGKASKKKPYLAVSTFVKKYGKSVEKGCFAKKILNGNTAYIIEYDKKLNTLSLICQENIKTVKSKILDIIIYPNSDVFFITYIDSADTKKNLSGYTLSRSSFTTNTSISLTNFKGTKEEKAKAIAFTKNATTILMSTLNDFLKSTKSGLTLFDLGFVNYSL